MDPPHTQEEKKCSEKVFLNYGISDIMDIGSFLRIANWLRF